MERPGVKYRGRWGGGRKGRQRQHATSLVPWPPTRSGVQEKGKPRDLRGERDFSARRPSASRGARPGSPLGSPPLMSPVLRAPPPRAAACPPGLTSLHLSASLPPPHLFLPSCKWVLTWVFMFCL